MSDTLADSIVRYLRLAQERCPVSCWCGATARSMAFDLDRATSDVSKACAKLAKRGLVRKVGMVGSSCSWEVVQ